MVNVKYTKNVKIILILGLFFIILTPIIGSMTETVTVADKSNRILDQESEVSIREADTYLVDIKKNQKVVIKFSVYAENVTASLKILGKGQIFTGNMWSNTNQKI